MENLMFHTKDGFLYEDGKHFTFINHKSGGYRKDKVSDGEGFFFSCFEEGSEEELKFFNKIRDLLRKVDKFKQDC